MQSQTGIGINSANGALRLPASAGDECLVIWDATCRARPSETLAAFVTQLAEVNYGEDHAQFVEAPMKFQRTGQMRLGVSRGVIKRPAP